MRKGKISFRKKYFFSVGAEKLFESLANLTIIVEGNSYFPLSFLNNINPTSSATPFTLLTSILINSYFLFAFLTFVNVREIFRRQNLFPISQTASAVHRKRAVKTRPTLCSKACSVCNAQGFAATASKMKVCPGQSLTTLAPFPRAGLRS